MYKYKIGFIGFGNMARAIFDGIVAKQIFDVNEIIAYDIEPQRFEGKNIVVAGSADELIENTQIILLCFKPQNLEEFCEMLKDKRIKIQTNQMLVSILAGIPIKKIKRMIKGDYAIARIMPNLPLQVGRGVSAVSFERVDEMKREIIMQIFRAAGIAFEVKEDLIDVVTGISGSGPAYVFYFMEALIAAAKEKGLSSKDAYDMVLNTFLGAVELAMKSGEDVAVLRQRVTSKGGTTERAISEFEKAELKEKIKKGVFAAIKRAEELGAEK